MTKRTLRIGMIGAGFIGQIAHLMNLVEVEDCRVVALAEFRPELRRRVAARYGIPRTYASHHELLADPEVEAVVVVVPRAYTGPVVLDCLEAGKHVLSEKPMAGTIEQGRRLVQAAERRGVHYSIGYMKRYDEGVQLAKHLFDGLASSGELGDVLFARAHCFMGDSYCKADGHVVTDEKAEYPEYGWPVYPDEFPEDLGKRYASYLNTYSHNVNLLRFMFDRTPTVESVHFANATSHLAVLGFDGFVASLETGRASNRGWDEVLEIYFAHGRLTVTTPPALLKNVPARVDLYRAGATQQTMSPLCDWTWSFRRQARGFVSNVLEGGVALSPAMDALEDLALIEDMWRRELARTSSIAERSRPLSSV